MFNSRRLRIAIIATTVAILAVGVWWAIRDKSNNGKTVAQNETGQTKESNDTITEVVIDQEKKHETQSEDGLTITGVVRDQAGMPVDGVEMEIFPFRDWFLRKYAEGRFEADWQPRSSSASMSRYLFVARHVQRNLAGAMEIDKDTNTLDVKLQPGVILTGKVVDAEDKGIEGARVMMILKGSNQRSAIPGLIMKTDAEGKFDFKAIPPGHKYSLNATTRGYRISKIEVHTDNARNNRIDVGPIVLARGEFSVSGVVVDTNGKPVANAWVYCTGKDQVGINSQTDTDGKFKVNGIFEGQVNITAALRLRKYGRWDAYGTIETEAGATNVKVVLDNQGAPPPKGRACFPADTDVWVNGMVVPILNVAREQTVGHIARAVPTAPFGQIEAIEEHVGTFECRDIVLENGNRISVVDAHCFMLDSGQWIAAPDLRNGQRLRTLDGTIGIKSVTTRATPFVGKVYNLRVKNLDRYMVGKDAVIVRDY